MDWIQAITIIITFIVFSGGAVLTMFIYLGNKMDAIRTDMARESKDFHGRLVSIEERYQQLIFPKKEIEKEKN